VTSSRSSAVITRPAIANERLSTNERGKIIYKFKQPFRDRTTHVVIDPLDFIARLAALLSDAGSRPLGLLLGVLVLASGNPFLVIVVSGVVMVRFILLQAVGTPLLLKARRRSGRPIAQFDAQIAAIAMSAGAGVATRNVSAFEGCGIEVIDPWRS
jgi:hypothetical protein